MIDLIGSISAGHESVVVTGNVIVGNVLADTITVMDDDKSNIIVNGVTISDDGSGNVIILSGTVTDDDNGNVTVIGDTIVSSLVGSFSASQELTGRVSMGDEIPLSKYEGEYEVTPSTSEDIVLNTAEKYMDADVTIKKILYAEVSNTTGGTTVTIGSEVI